MQNGRRRWQAFTDSIVVIIISVTLTSVTCRTASAQDEARPNILWITCEDMSPNLGCFGDPNAITPNIDRLAAQGVTYTRAFSVAGVCAPSRSCLITGVYPSSIGTHHMRCQGELPSFMRCFTEYLRDAGYYCSNNSKEDYNFRRSDDAWDESSRQAHWRNRESGQPFFSVFNFTTTHESQIRVNDETFANRTARLAPEQRHDPNEVTVPAYHPDTAVVRRDWARCHDLITAMDMQVQDVLDELEADGLAEDTVVFFYSDHGVGLPRGKRWLYDSGMHVPLIVKFPTKYQHLAPGEAGSKTDRLVSFVDFGPTVLSLAEVQVPSHMQGKPFLGAQEAPPRDYVFGIRDRMDERTDFTRAVRDKRYKYIRNYMPYLPYAQHLQYMEQMPTMQELRRLAASGDLAPAAAHWMQPTKPVEELYDTEKDPDEVENLVNSSEHQDILNRLRQAHAVWTDETRDLGYLPEAELRIRSEGTTSYEMGRSGNYPLARIRQAAIAAADDERAPADLVKLVSDEDAAVRFWAVTGMGIGNSHNAMNLPALRRGLSDESANVRIAAADALYRRGRIRRPLRILGRELNHDHDWVRHAAVFTADRMGTDAEPLLPQVREMQDDDNNYVVRIVEHIVAEPEK